MPSSKSLIVAVVVLALWAFTIGLLIPGFIDEGVVALITYYLVGRVM